MWYYPHNRILFSNKRNGVLIHATTWMNLQNIMLSKRNQAQKNSHIIPLIQNVQNRQIYRNKKEMVVALTEVGWRSD